MNTKRMSKQSLRIAQGHSCNLMISFAWSHKEKLWFVVICEISPTKYILHTAVCILCKETLHLKNELPSGSNLFLMFCLGLVWNIHSHNNTQDPSVKKTKTSQLSTAKQYNTLLLVTDCNKWIIIIIIILSFILYRQDRKLNESLLLHQDDIITYKNQKTVKSFPGFTLPPLPLQVSRKLLVVGHWQPLNLADHWHGKGGSSNRRLSSRWPWLAGRKADLKEWWPKKT